MTTSLPRRRAKRLALAAGVLAAVLASTAPYATAQPAPTAPAATATATTVQEYYPNVDHIVCEVNKERTDKGLSPLFISDRASDVAQNHARDMAGMGKLTSTGSDGRNLRARLSNAGIYSNLIHEFMFSGYNHDGYFADMATDPREDNEFYKVLMSSDTVALGLGYDHTYWDVDLLGHHRRLNTRSAVCTKPQDAKPAPHARNRRPAPRR